MSLQGTVNLALDMLNVGTVEGLSSFRVVQEQYYASLLDGVGSGKATGEVA